MFAKNSDRPPGEAQIIEAISARPPGGSLRTQYRVLRDLGAPALFGARPTWLWGFEHGVNAHRVAIGNEQLWTIDSPVVHADSFTGMDLVRLGLERSERAEQALEVIIALLEEFGQGGVGEQGTDGAEGKAYFSSFLIADPTEAWVLETSGRAWAARRVTAADHGVALSNRISLTTDWTRASTDVERTGDFDQWRRASSPTAHADKRLAVTTPAARAASGEGSDPRQVAAVLRHHGTGVWGAPGHPGDEVGTLPPAVIDRLGTGVSVCMHLTGVQATTSSMITWLPRDPGQALRSWVAPGNPCVSVFVPTFGVDGLAPELADGATWDRFRRLRDRVEQARATEGDGGSAALTRIRSVLGPIETELWDEADRAAATGPADRASWARALWPRVEAGLVALGV